MATTLPSDATNANCDAATDDPQQALLVDLKQCIDKFNDLKEALGSLAQLAYGPEFTIDAQPIGTPDKLQIITPKTSFTPTIQDSSLSDAEGQVYGSWTSGYYFKIGNEVFFDLRILITDLGTLTGTDAVIVANMPFASASLADTRFNFTVGTATSLALPSAMGLTAYMNPGNDYFNVHVWDSTAGATSLTINELSTNGSLTISGRYTV